MESKTTLTPEKTVLEPEESMKTSRILSLLSVFLLGGFLPVFLAQAQAAPSSAPTKPATVWDALKAEKDLSKFADILKKAGLDADLSKLEARITVFAPSNAAMDKMGGDVEKRMKDMKEGAKTLANHHIISGSAVYATNIKGRRASPSGADGSMISFDGTGKTLKVGDSTIVREDLRAPNGVVHVIDSVMLPESLQDPKIKEAAREKEEKTMREEMEKRETAMKEEMKKREADMAKKDAAAKAPPVPSAPAVPSAPPVSIGGAVPVAAPPSVPDVPSVAVPVATKTSQEPKAEKKGFFQKLFGK